MAIRAERDAVDLAVLPQFLFPFLLVNNVDGIRGWIHLAAHDARQVLTCLLVSDDRFLDSWMECHIKFSLTTKSYSAHS